MGKKGFTLIEMAVVLVLIGAVIMFTSKVATGLLRQNGDVREKRLITEAMSTVVDYAKRGAAFPLVTTSGSAKMGVISIGSTPLQTFSGADYSAWLYPENICAKVDTGYTLRLCPVSGNEIDCQEISNLAGLIVNNLPSVKVSNSTFSYFRDISPRSVYAYITLPELQAQVGCSSLVNILPEELPRLAYDVTAASTVKITTNLSTPAPGTGSVANFSWCMDHLQTNFKQEFDYSAGGKSYSSKAGGTKCFDSGASEKWVTGNVLTLTVPAGASSGNYPIVVYISASDNTSKVISQKRYAISVN